MRYLLLLTILDVDQTKKKKKNAFGIAPEYLKEGLGQRQNTYVFFFFPILVYMATESEC